MKETMIELIQKADGCSRHYAEVIADCLIDNDVVPVVRCKDCKYYDAEERYCMDFCACMIEDDFCSYGERRG